MIRTSEVQMIRASEVHKIWVEETSHDLYLSRHMICAEQTSTMRLSDIHISFQRGGYSHDQ